MMCILQLALLLASVKGKAAIAVGSEIPAVGVKDANSSDANSAATWASEVSILVNDTDIKLDVDPSNGTDVTSGNRDVNVSHARSAITKQTKNSGAAGINSGVDLGTVGESKPLLEDRIEELVLLDFWRSKLPGTSLPIVFNTSAAGARSEEDGLKQSGPSLGSMVHVEIDTNKHSGTDKMDLAMESEANKAHADNAGDTNDVQHATEAMHSNISTTVKSISGLEDVQQPPSSASQQKKLQATGALHNAWAQLSLTLLGGTMLALTGSCICIVFKVSAMGMGSHFQRIADSRTPKRYGRRGGDSPGRHEFYMV